MANGLEEKTAEPTKYSFEDAVKSATEYFNGDDLAGKVFVNKYALKDSFGNIYESNPDQMHHRIAREISRIEKEKKYKNPLTENEVYDLLKDFKYIVPQGSPMSGIGNNYQIVSLSNCFVIGGKNDSYGGIMRVDEEQVQLMKRRGGVGHDLSHIRPKRSPVKNSALTSTGVVPFMERYSNSTREVAQDGRRGALMLSLSIKHPDAEDFIDAKMRKGKVTGANISVRIDDEFMEAVKNNTPYIQQFPVDSKNPAYSTEIDARKLWEKIIHNAWKSAEPGILYWDTITGESIPDLYSEFGFKTTSTNPCGEIPLCPYDSCRLIALNLHSYIEQPFTPNAKFNHDLFSKHVKDTQKIMDDIIDLEIEKVDGILNKIKSDPEDEETKRAEYNLWKNIKEKAEQGRRTGIGVTGEGDMLAAMGLRYGSEEGNDFSENIHKTLAIEAYRGSVELAKERGAFPIYDAEKEKDNPFILRIKNEDEELYQEMVKHGRRNIALLTIAPTGTTSLMTQTTSGLEPVFLPVYKRRRKVNPNDKNVKVAFVDEVGDSWEEYNVFHHKFVDWMVANGYNVTKKFSEEEIEEMVKKSPYHKATSNDVDWIKKVELQGRVQKWVDHSISVTINMPKDTPKEIVAEAYMKAWEAKCKGVTVYVDGSRSGVLLSGKEGNGFPKKRPKSLDAEVLRFTLNDQINGGEKWLSFVGMIDGKPYELFTGKKDEEILAVPNSINEGKIVKEKNEEGESHYDFVYVDRNKYESKIGGISHQFNRANWNNARMISGMLRNDVPAIEVIDIVSKLDEGAEGINTWKAGVIRTLNKYVPDGTETNDTCKDCGDHFHYEEGCKKCSCGSKCE